VKRTAQPHTSSHLHVVCPFCRFPVDSTTKLTWCGNCFVEFKITRAGNVVFDDQLKTPRFALAKALGRAGGVQIGKRTDAD